MVERGRVGHASAGRRTHHNDLRDARAGEYRMRERRKAESWPGVGVESRGELRVIPV